MSKELKDKAKEYLKAGLSVIPTKEDKRPALPSWSPYQKQRINEAEVESLFTGGNIKGLGIICGAISGGLEVIDVDTKHDTTGSLWDELRGLIEDNLPELYSRLVIAQTKSGGYHIYYRCSSIAGNLKLSSKKNREPLIETRGEGGYVIAPPSPNYKNIQGEPGNIPTITPQEREILFSISKSFNEVETESAPPPSLKAQAPYKKQGLSPWEDYNQRGDIIELLESKGWRVVSHRGERINLLKPNSKNSKTSGNYHTGLKVLRVFSTSTEFNPEKGYSPSQAFTLLECNGDNKKAYRMLLELGYGEPSLGADRTPSQVETERIKVEAVNTVNRITSAISTPGETLKIETLKSLQAQEVIITSPSPEAQAEVERAIDLILLTGKRITIKEGESELREYKYLLRSIFDKYSKIIESKGGLTDTDIDSLLDEVVILGGKLQPLDRDRLTNYFTSQPDIQALGITQESLTITIEKLRATKDKEAQAIAFNSLLSEAHELHEKGETEKALELLRDKGQEVRAKSLELEFNSLLEPSSEAEVKKAEEIRPSDLDTGYRISGEELLLPGGAITVFAGATGHAKTTLSINTALNIALKYPDKKFIFFTYEENQSAIIQYFLNVYLDRELNNSTSPKSNRRLIKEFFKTGSTQYISGESLSYFQNKKEEFFKHFIEPGRILIKYVDFNATELDLAIRYLHKKEESLGAVFVDYFQLLNLPGDTKKALRTNSRQEELKEICQSLKRIAIDTGLPLLLAAQFNRDVTDLTKLHPTKLGEAGDIERIVHTLVGLWDVSKSILSKDTSKGEESEIKKRTGEASSGLYVELLKSRDLPTGNYELLEYNGKTGKIKNSSSPL